VLAPARSPIADVVSAEASYVRPASRGRGHLLGLVWTLVRTDFKVRYHGTLGGFAWALLKPVTMFVVLMSVFSFAFATEVDYRLNLILGLFLWDFFAEGTKVGLQSLLSKGYLLGKTRFPRWILVVTSCSNALVTLVVFSLVFVAWLAWSGRAPGPVAVALYATYLVFLVLIVIGFALGTSPLFLRYRDLNQVWEVLSHAGFFLAPIIYPLGIMPERYHFYLYLWPPTPVIQYARAVLVNGAVPSLRAHVLLGAVALVTLGSGILLFRRFSPRAAEHL
jgi:lipopolysaccharide transport system permease protein